MKGNRASAEEAQRDYLEHAGTLFSLQGTQQGKLAHQRWLEERQGLVMWYARQRWGLDGQEMVYELYEANPWKLRALVEDAFRDNAEKIRSFINYIAHSESKIIMVEGGRGAGKTSTVGCIAARVSRAGRRVAYFGLQRVIPSWPRTYGPSPIQIYDLRQAKQGDLVIIDESAQMFNSRASTSKGSRELPSTLALLRHMGLTGIVITQNSSINDIAFSKFVDCFWFKPLSLTQGNMSRGTSRGIMETFREMVPTRKDMNFVLSDEMPPMTFYFPRDPWWEMRFSQGYQPFEGPKQAFPIVLRLRAIGGWDWGRIAGAMETMGVRRTPQWWESYILTATDGIDPMNHPAIADGPLEAPEEPAYGMTAAHVAVKKTLWDRQTAPDAIPAEEDL